MLLPLTITWDLWPDPSLIGDKDAPEPTLGNLQSRSLAPPLNTAQPGSHHHTNEDEERNWLGFPPYGSG